MMHRNKKMRSVSGILAAALLFAFSGTPSLAVYDDFDEITSHVSAGVRQTLSVSRPAQDIATSAADFYLTGGSNPDEALTLNGTAVEDRGIFGSWGVFTALEPGENRFVLQNGEDSVSVTITRGAASVTTTRTLSKQTPFYDVALDTGDVATLACVAPSGGRVTASVGGKKIALTQKAAAADGVPAAFEGTIVIPPVSGTQPIGNVTYNLTFDGEVSTFSSEGVLYAVGEGENLVVEMKDTASTVFAEDFTTSGFVATAKKGAVETVTEISGDMYKLAMGGWVLQSVAQPVTSTTPVQNKVSDVRFEADAGGEQFIFAGTGKPVFQAYQDGERLSVTFAHTTGVRQVPVKDSQLFNEVRVTAQDGDTTLAFMRNPNRRLWGYYVEYDDSGNTIIYCKYAPQLAAGTQPLKNVTVALDPGHGGDDPGAPGIPATGGPMEKDINHETALAVKKRLEKLGASVVMTRDGDVTLSLSDRMWTSQQAKADYFIALHSNAFSGNGLKPNGVEVYYYEDIAKGFAQTLLNQVSAQTNRVPRRAAYSNYKVTLCTYAPAVLLEMGFVTNPVEYDNLCSRRGIFDLANAIGDALIASLS